MELCLKADFDGGSPNGKVKIMVGMRGCQIPTAATCSWLSGWSYDGRALASPDAKMFPRNVQFSSIST
jgi:hypothetical protein